MGRPPPCSPAFKPVGEEKGIKEPSLLSGPKLVFALLTGLTYHWPELNDVAVPAAGEPKIYSGRSSAWMKTISVGLTWWSSG